MKRIRLWGLLTAAAVLLGLMPQAVWGAGAELSVTLMKCEKAAAEDVYDLEAAIGAHNGQEPAAGARLTAMLLGSRPNGVTDTPLKITVGAAKRDAYLYYIAQGETDGAGIWSLAFQARLPQMQAADDFICLYAGGENLTKQGLTDGTIHLPANPVRVETALTSQGQQPASVHAPDSGTEAAGDVTAAAYDAYGSRITPLPDPVWKIYSYQEAFSRASVVSPAQAYVEEGRLILTDAARSLAGRKLAVEAQVKKLDGSVIDSPVEQFPHDILVTADSQPEQVFDHMAVETQQTDFSIPVLQEDGTEGKTEISYTAACYDTDGLPMTLPGQVVWSVRSTASEDLTNRVSVSPEGVVTVESSAAALTAGTVMVRAENGGKSAETAIPLTRDASVAREVRVTSDHGQIVLIPETGEEPVTFTASVIDQYGLAIGSETAQWSLAGQDAAMTAEAVELPESPEGETYTIKVRPGAKELAKKDFSVIAAFGEKTAEARVVLSSVPPKVTVSGPDTVSASSAASFQAEATGPDGAPIEQAVINWGLAAPYLSVTIDNNGTVTAQKGAASGVITVTAELVGSRPAAVGKKLVQVIGGGSGSSGGGGGGGSRGGSSAMVYPPGISNPQKPEPVPEETKVIPDMSESHWAFQPVQNLIEKGVVSGDADTGAIRPDDAVSREELAAVLLRSLKIEPQADAAVSDENSSEWAAGILAAAREHGILNGDGAGRMNGRLPATRAETIVMLARAAELPEGDIAALQAYQDYESIPLWARGAFAALAQNGSVSGYEDGTLRPMAEITRAEAFVLTDRVLQENK